MLLSAKKKAIIALTAAIFIGTAANSSQASGTSLADQETASFYSPQVCQFSLTSYSGTIDGGGNTGSFKVGLSCPQEEDVRATVVVFIDNEHAASKVVTVKAGQDYSETVYINTGASNSGKRYKLVVQ